MRSENVVDLLHIESDPLCHRLRGSLLQQLWGDFQVNLNRLRLQVDNFQVDNFQVDTLQVILNRVRLQVDNAAGQFTGGQLSGDFEQVKVDNAGGGDQAVR